MASIDLTTAALHSAAVVSQPTTSSGQRDWRIVEQMADNMLAWLEKNTDKIEMNEEKVVPVHGFFQPQPAPSGDSSVVDSDDDVSQ